MSTSSDAIRSAAQALLPVLPERAWLPHGLVRKPNGDLDKPPREGATTDNPASWFTLPAALEKLTGTNNVAGIGFAIVRHLITLDFDHCRDQFTGELNDETRAELERCNSFAYITPSKTGIRIVGLNDTFQPIPGGKRNRWTAGKQKIEIFIGPTNHYNTFTSDLIPGYATIRDISDVTLDYLQFLDPGRRSADNTKPVSNPDPQRSIAAIRAALTVIPNEVQDWDEWNRIGMAVWRSSGGSGAGLDAWAEWSARNPCNGQKDTCDDRWQHYFGSPPTKIGFGSLYYEARKIRPLFVPPFDPLPEEDGGDGTATGDKLPFEATPVESLDLEIIPPRRWVYGRELIRGYVSVLAAIGGAGKTAYAMSSVICIALGRALLGVKVHGRGIAWLYNLEDPAEEMRRRLVAIMRHMGVTKADLVGRLYLDSGRDRGLMVTVRARDGSLYPAPIVDALVAEIKRRGVTTFVPDPLVHSHGASENNNEEMAFVMSLWARVAHEGDCAVWLIHHFRKGGQGGDADAVRGAGAIQGAARAMHTLAVMSEEEAERLGVKPDDRRTLVRHDSVKQNMAAPAARATWYRLVSVNLGNATFAYPEGDEVQALESWEPPSPWAGLTWDMISLILTRIEAGPEPGEYYSLSKQAGERWAAHAIMAVHETTPGPATEILKQWYQAGLLVKDEYTSKKLRQKTGCVRVDSVLFQKMRAGSATPKEALGDG